MKTKSHTTAWDPPLPVSITRPLPYCPFLYITCSTPKTGHHSVLNCSTSITQINSLWDSTNTSHFYYARKRRPTPPIAHWGLSSHKRSLFTRIDRTSDDTLSSFNTYPLPVMIHHVITPDGNFGAPIDDIGVLLLDHVYFRYQPHVGTFHSTFRRSFPELIRSLSRFDWARL